MEINGIPQAFVKMAKTFQYYYILAAGHMVKHYLDQNTEKVWKNADFNRTVHVLCCPIRIFSTFVTVDLVTYTRLSHSSPQGGLSLGFHIRVVPHQWSHIRVVFHQGGFRSGWSFIRVASHQDGLTSWWPVIRVVLHQGGLSISSGLSLIMVVTYQDGLSSFLSAEFSYFAVCRFQPTTGLLHWWCWNALLGHNQKHHFHCSLPWFYPLLWVHPISNSSVGIMVLRRMVHSCCNVLIVLIH